MTQKRLIEETNKNSWETLHILQRLTGESEQSIKRLYDLCLDTFDYADLLRNLTYRFIKFPSEANKDAVLKQIGSIHKLSERMSDLEFLERKHNHIDTEEREKGDYN